MKMASMNCSGCKPVITNNMHVAQVNPAKQQNSKQNLNCAGCGSKGLKLNKTA